MSERSEAKRDGARLQKNSGRGKIQKGDSVMGDFVVDYKEYNESISVSKKMWAKICSDAFTVSRDKHPVLKLVLGDKYPTRIAVIEWDTFMEMKEAWECQKAQSN